MEKEPSVRLHHNVKGKPASPYATMLILLLGTVHGTRPVTARTRGLRYTRIEQTVATSHQTHRFQVYVVIHGVDAQQSSEPGNSTAIWDQQQRDAALRT